MSIKTPKICTLVLLTLALLVTSVNLNAVTLKAQTNGTVIMFSSIGGSTSPSAGTTSYPDGTQVTLQASSVSGYFFVNWQISTDTGISIVVADNPFTLTIAGGTTYTIQPIFVAIQAPPGIAPVSVSNLTSAAIVVLLQGVGGTTNPPPGVYAAANATTFNILAIPNSGWKFDHWVIGGGVGVSNQSVSLNNITSYHGGFSFIATPTDNPYNINHGYGYTFTYQPVFSPTTSPSPSPTIGEFSSAAVAIVAVILIAAVFGAYAFTKKAKR